MHGDARSKQRRGNTASDDIGGGAAFVLCIDTVERGKAVEPGGCLVHAQQHHRRAEQRKALQVHGQRGEQASHDAEGRATLQTAFAAELLHPACECAHAHQVAEHQERERKGGDHRPWAQPLANQRRERDADDGARPVQGLCQAQHGKLGVAAQDHMDLPFL